MFTSQAQEQAPADPDLDVYRGAQYELIIRLSGALGIFGAMVALALMPFYPPTVQIGAIGWAVVIPLTALSIVGGVLDATLKRRPSLSVVHATSFTSAVQIAALMWLAGGGKAPFVQLLILPMFGAAVGQPLNRCVPVLLVASAAALSPLLYSNIDVLATVTEFAVLSMMSVMTAMVITSTRTHRARLMDAGEHANVLAHVDPLTGMANRRAFDEALAQIVESSVVGGPSISLLLCDVNSFKQVNDTFGHAVGDEVLQAIARALSEAVRKPDAAFRWAGDEFAVILRDSDERGATRVAARIRDAVSRQCRRPDGVEITIGTGVAELEPGMSINDVLIEADRALFSHKAERSHLVGAA
jgi:diguanylate cyclase (GGDEF)-like protein